MPFPLISPRHADTPPPAPNMPLKQLKNMAPSRAAGLLSSVSQDAIPGVVAVMTLCLDLHTHHPAPQPIGVVASQPTDFQPLGNQLYSIGIHPWDSAGNISDEIWNLLQKQAAEPCVGAIGECGIDLIKGGPLFRQLLIFKRQVQLSEEMGKPLIIHDVKAHDIILGLKRDLKPTQKWAIHGFRGKPALARMMTAAGLWISFGEKFNPDTLLSMPENRILAETDESPLSIQEIIARMSDVRGYDLSDTIAHNTNLFLSLDNIDETITENEYIQ